jgi:TolA-binding protein
MSALDFKKVAERYEQAADAERNSTEILNSARSRFAEKLHGVDAPKPSLFRRAVPVLAFAAVAAAVTFLVWPEAPLGVQVRGEPGTPVEFVDARGAERVMDFSDGSEVRVREDSRLRLLGVGPNGAQVALERGSAHVSVVHKQKTKWVFSAGPYRVHVIGTQFELRWNPDTSGLEVEMDEGIVEVEGPGLQRQRVTTKQKLEAFAEPASASLYLDFPSSEQADGDGKNVTRRVKRTAPATDKAAVVEKPRATGASWRQLADQGDEQGAMNAAEQAGFTWLANSMPRGDVLVLGDVALEAKQPARATEAWLAVRARFSGSAGASEAAIRLGKLADMQHDVDGAVKWFRQAAREAPNAATTPVALGEWFDVLARAGRKDEAKQVASEYLKRFKNGPSAAAARQVLAE